LKDLILALDRGTTSSRALIFDSNGTILAQAQKEFAQHYPKPGWVEHEPQDILTTTMNTARAAISQLPGARAAIVAIGLTNQRETTLLWNRRSDKPLANAIVWQCRRTADICQQIKAEGFDREIQALTGLVSDPYFSGTKLAWLLQNIPGARAGGAAANPGAGNRSLGFRMLRRGRDLWHQIKTVLGGAAGWPGIVLPG
jgi:glycerol kinase